MYDDPYFEKPKPHNYYQDDLYYCMNASFTDLLPQYPVAESETAADFPFPERNMKLPDINGQISRKANEEK